MPSALFVAKQIDRDRVDYISRRTGIRYTIAPDLSEYGNPGGFEATSPNNLFISQSKSELFTLIELADKCLI